MASIVVNSISDNNSVNNSINDKNGTEKTKPKFKNVIISLENSILPKEKLCLTPSMADGLDYQHEVDLRILGCELIQTSGILLRLPQVAMATGQVLFQRYYYSKSLVRFPMETTAMACVTLASKIEEAPRRIRDVLNVFHHMKQIRLQTEEKPLVLDENYILTKNNVIKAERRLLKELGFCVHVKHPHKFIVTLLQVLENEKNHQLMQTSWNYMNDSLRSDVFVRYSPETIGCACVHLSARLLRVALPSRPNWFEVFGISETEIKDVCVSILKLYSRPKPNQEELEAIVDELRKTHENAKLKAKELSVNENGTPSGNRSEVSPNSRPVSPLPKPKSENVSPKNKLKSVSSVVTHSTTHSSPSKKRVRDSPNDKRSRSKSRTLSPINRDKSYSNYERDRNYNRERERSDRSPPKSYSYDYTRSGSRSPDRSGRHNHKHKRITYSRSRSRSPVHSHRHHNHHNSKHHSYSMSRKSSKRSKSPFNRDDRNSYHSNSRSRGSRSRDRSLYPYRS